MDRQTGERLRWRAHIREDMTETDPPVGSPASTRPTDLADEAALEDFISEHEVAVVEFYTNGCGLCTNMKPIVGNVGRHCNVPVGFINPRDDPPLVDRFEVQSVPLIVLFVGGEPVARRAEGYISGDDLTAWIDAETAAV